MKRALSIILSAVLVFSAAGCGGVIGSSDSAGNIEPETVAETETVPETAAFINTPDPDAPDKSENVHVEADASGNAEKITVEVELKNPGDDAPISDLTDLKDIKNKEGDEEFSLKEETLTWENHGTNIKYEGTSEKELPVTLKVSYFLNGEPLSADEIAGKSGHVKIRFDYENCTNETVTVKDAEYSVPIPFTAITAAFLPSDHFRNIKTENGKVMKLEDNAVVMGMAFPGLSDALKLKAWEPAEDIDIPEFVEIEADVSDFSLDFTATIVTNGLLEDMEEDDLKDLDDMAEGMDDLTEAIDDMTDGTDELYDGLDEVQDYLKKYADGVGSLDKGIRGLSDGISEINSQKKALISGAEELCGGLSELGSGIEKMNAGGSSGISEEDKKALLMAVKNLSSQTKALSDMIDAALEDQKEAVQFTEDAQAYTDQLKKSYKKVKKKLNAIDLSAIDSEATKKARKQAAAALEEALEDTDLSEKQIKKIKKKVKNSIDLTGISSGQAEELAAAVKALKKTPDLKIPEISWDQKKAKKLLKKMEGQAEVILSFSDKLFEMTAGAAAIGEGISELSAGVSALSEGSASFLDGLNAFCAGISALEEGASQLKGGSKKLKSAGSRLTDGMGELKDGVKEMSDGLKDFREDGLEDLKKTSGPEFKRILNTIRALKESDLSYDSYSGLLPGKTGEVRFLIETEEIK